MSTTKTSPFDLPELRLLISQLVSINDAISCTQVCRDWTNDFAGAVWHTIDFNVHQRFTSLNPKTVQRYGHRIRVVKGLAEPNQLATLQCPSVSNIHALTMVIAGTPLVIAGFYDLLRRNSASLTYAHISHKTTNGAAYLYFNVDALSPNANTSAVSKLKTLRISGLAFTREAFSSLLCMCPALSKLHITNVALSGTRFAEIYQHPRVSCLSASLAQILRKDHQSPNGVSLLQYFPNLKELEIRNTSNSSAGSMLTLRLETAMNMQLKSLITSSRSSIVVEMLTQGFRRLEAISLRYSNISPEVLMAILTHQKTLKTVRGYLPEEGFPRQNSLSVLQDHLRSSSWMVQLVPQTCRSLQNLYLPQHEMNIDEMEQAEWSCSDLRNLYVRIKGLDSLEKINRAVQIWVLLRREGDPNASSDTLMLPVVRIALQVQSSTFSIEWRVARYLCRFKKLQRIWLGTKTWAA